MLWSTGVISISYHSPHLLLLPFPCFLWEERVKYVPGCTPLMGKNSYEVVSNFDTWPYEGKRVVILSSTLTSVCEKAELFKGDITHLIEKLHADGIKHVYVDGGATISQFLNMGLIDQMIISIIPIVLGSGIPLFSKINSDKWFRLTSSQAYSNCLVQLRYDLVK